jgi:hypothetical protein
MSTDKPVGAMLITEHEAGQIGRANASGRTPGSLHPWPVAAVQQLGPLGRPVRDCRMGGTDTPGGPTTRRRPRRPVHISLAFLRFTRGNAPPSVGREVRKDSADAQFGDSREP